MASYVLKLSQVPKHNTSWTGRLCQNLILLFYDPKILDNHIYAMYSSLLRTSDLGISISSIRLDFNIGCGCNHRPLWENDLDRDTMNEVMELLGNILRLVEEIKTNADVIKTEIKDVEDILVCGDCYEYVDNVGMIMTALFLICDIPLQMKMPMM